MGKRYDKVKFLEENEYLSNSVFGLSSDNAVRLAWDYMNQEVRINERIAQYQYKNNGYDPPHIDIVDDKGVYLVPNMMKQPIQNIMIPRATVGSLQTSSSG